MKATCVKCGETLDVTEVTCGKCVAPNPLKKENERLLAEVAAWQYRFPDYCYDVDSDSVVEG